MSRSGQRVSRTIATATRTATTSAATRTPPWCGRVADGDSIACLAARLDSVTAGRVITACDVRHPRFATADDLSGQRIVGWVPRGDPVVLGLPALTLKR
jgi:hypothetical protein